MRANLSIRINFVGSIEFFRDAVLDDPRLSGMGPSPPIGVMPNDAVLADPRLGVESLVRLVKLKAIVDVSREIQGERSGV